MENLQYQIRPQQTTQIQCVPFLTSLQVPTIPQQEAHTHSLSPNFMHNCEHPTEMGWMIISCCAPFIEVKIKAHSGLLFTQDLTRSEWQNVE